MNIVDKLNIVKESAERVVENNHPGYSIKDVIHYNKQIEITDENSGMKEKFNLCVILIENPDNKEEVYKLYYLVKGDKLENLEINEVEIEDLIKNRELQENIKDVVDKTEENEKLSKKEQDEELKKDSLEELEKKEKEVDKAEEKETKLMSDTGGATSLNQEVDGRTLRNLIGLDGDDAYIKPISASEAKRKYGKNINTKDGIEIIKKDGTSRLAGNDIFEQDTQEGNNSFNKDLNIEVDGNLEYKSNTTSLEFKNMPNHYISIGYDEMSTKKEMKFSKRSGRDGHREPEKELIKKGASEYQDPDQRNMTRRNEEGIGEPDEILERQKVHEKTGCKSDRVENIDNYENNDISHINPDDRIEGTDITWKQFANMCGYRGEDGIERAHKEFIKYKEENPDFDNNKVIENIEDDMIEGSPAGNRNI